MMEFYKLLSFQKHVMVPSMSSNNFKEKLVGTRGKFLTT